jgi:hypothetical protein
VPTTSHLVKSELYEEEEEEEDDDWYYLVKTPPPFRFDQFKGFRPTIENYIKTLLTT